MLDPGDPYLAWWQLSTWGRSWWWWLGLTGPFEGPLGMAKRALWPFWGEGSQPPREQIITVTPPSPRVLPKTPSRVTSEVTSEVTGGKKTRLQDFLKVSYWKPERRRGLDFEDITHLLKPAQGRVALSSCHLFGLVYWGPPFSSITLCTQKDLISVHSPDPLQCGDPRSRLDASLQLGAPLSLEMKDVQIQKPA